VRHRLNLQRLSQILASSNLSQNHWALRLGLSRGHWSDLVNGRHPYPSAKTRTRMTEVFGVEDLFVAEPGAGAAGVDLRMAISGRYELTTELGHGGMGTVYLAHDLALGRLVALKVVAAEAAAGVGADQLLKEIAHVSRLHHPHILPLFDAGSGAGSPYYVMPFVRAGSLGRRLRAEGRLALPEVLPLVRGIAAGLGHAHEQRVLHCDIKPENILLDGPHAYLMDFGIARKLHTEAEEWGAIRKELDFSAGTPAYVSPEQAAGDRIDERSDVYSLACVVYEMLSGRPAFAGDNTEQIVSLRFREPPPPLRESAPETPIAVVQAIEAAMARDPQRRPPTAQAFAAELTQAAASASPMRIAVAGASLRARRWVAGQTGTSRRPAARPGALRRWMSELRRDLAYAVRQRRRAPALTVVSLVTLALAIGLTTAVFAIVDGVLLRPLPFVEPERLVALESVDSTGASISTVSSANWSDWKRLNRTLSASAIYREGRVSVGIAATALRAQSAYVTAGFFDAVGARFRAGRGFDSASVASGEGGAVISEGFWRRELGGSASVGATITVNGNRTPVIGILASGQEFPAGAEVWTAFQPRELGGAMRNNINWHAIGRLRPDATVAEARSDLSQIAHGIRAEDPVALYSYGVDVRPLREQLVGDTGPLLTLLAGAVGVVLLIACANLASTNLARGAYHQREMAVRSALGAGRRRLIRQVLVEHLSLALVGGVAGLGLAAGLVQSAAILAPAELPRFAHIAIDARILAAALLVSTLAGILTGILPAIQASRSAPNDILSGAARGAVTGGRGLPGRMLVGAEVALAVLLVSGAGLLLRSLGAVLARPLGFETAHVVTVEISLGGPRFEDDSTAVFGYWDRLLRELGQTPNVRSVGLTNFVPLVRGGTGFIEVEGKDLPGAGAGYRMISPGYFDALGMTLLAGRRFGHEDRAGSPRVALVNAKLAATYWPGESPLGKRLRATSMEPVLNRASPEWITVVGVVNDVRHFGYVAEPHPEMFVLYRQLRAWRLTMLTAMVRGTGAGGTAALFASVRAAVARADPGIPADLATLESAARRVTAERRFASAVLQAFGALALLLAGIGVYGMLAFSVAQRTRELAVRSALGADRERLLRLVILSAATVIGIGIVLGIVGALVSGRVLESLLFEVSPGDPLVLFVAAAIIGIIGAIAAIIPARRATRIDPMVVLRNE
jgi:putative ABC transport system permease protein